MSWQGEERRHTTLTEDQMDAIAERAAEKAIQKVYEVVGKSIVHKFFWFVGAATLAILAWMAGKGIKL